MNEDFALRYAETRRKELGAEAFDVSFRHLSLEGSEERKFAAQGQMWLLTSADLPVRVTSDTGHYHLPSTTIREQMHEHTGQLTVGNNAPRPVQVQFIVITWQYPRRLTAPGTVSANSAPVAPVQAPGVPVTAQNQAMPSLPPPK